MVLLTTTPQILSILSSLPPSAISTLTSTLPPPKDNTDDSTSSLPTATTHPISHRTLIALTHLPNLNGQLSIPALNTLLRGTRPYVPPPPPKPTPTPEYTALMTRLRNEQEAREYTAMLHARRHQDRLTTDPNEQDPDNISPSVVFNVLLSVVMCAVAVFQVTRWYASDAVRVLLSLATGAVVGVAEVGVYSIYLLKVRRAKERERAKVERKVVLGEWVPPELEESGSTAVGEKEEIWGRGVNGGMRRRVREKWERENEM